MNQKEKDQFMRKCVDELITIYSYQYTTRERFGELIDELMEYPDITIRDFFEMYKPKPEEEDY
tara:strand:- start:450 stop:638 length:189 start_codon:yes stop_codon:yes gene_type:complete